MTALNPGDTILGTISMTSILLGLPLNLTMLVYFVTYTGKRTLSFLLYTQICVVDIIIIVCHLPTTLSYLANRNPLLFNSNIFCSIWGLIWNTTMRVSVFIIAVLCVSRMVAVVFPLRKPSRNVPLVLILLYGLLMLLQSSLPFWYLNGYYYDSSGVTCYDNRDYGPVHYFFVGLLEFLAPLIVVLPACVTSIASLYRTRAKERKYSANKNNVRLSASSSATLTIILLTIAYVVFNAPLVLYTLFAFLQVATGTTIGDNFLDAFHGERAGAEGHFHLLNFTFTVSVCLNSTANAILFTSRCSAMKSWLKAALFTRGALVSKNCKRVV